MVCDGVTRMGNMSYLGKRFKSCLNLEVPRYHRHFVLLHRAMERTELIEVVDVPAEIRARRYELIRYLLADTGWGAGVCWSVWSPRENFQDRTSSRLKAYNQRFCDLADVASPGPQKLEELIPPPQLLAFLSEEARLDCVASYHTVARVNDLFYTGELDQTVGVVTHVSKIGRLNYALVRQICLRMNGTLQELVTAEMPFPPGVRVAPYYVPHVPTPTLTTATTRPLQLQQLSPHESAGSIHWVHEKPLPVLPKKKKLPDGFRCTACGVTNTPEARHGPHGRGTLCNRCGIRWAKTKEQEQEAAIALTGWEERRRNTK